MPDDNDATVEIVIVESDNDSDNTEIPYEDTVFIENYGNEGKNDEDEK